MKDTLQQIMFERFDLDCVKTIGLCFVHYIYYFLQFLLKSFLKMMKYSTGQMIDYIESNSRVKLT